MAAEFYLDRNAAREIVRSELEQLQQRIASNIRSTGTQASGRTAASMRVEATEEEGTLFGNAPFGVLETGRAGGKIPYDFRGILLEWMRAKGVHGRPIPYVRVPSARWQPKYTPQERGDLSMAGAIAFRISQSGSRLFRVGGRADIYSNEIPKTLESVAQRIQTLITTAFDSIKLNDQTIGD